MAAKKNTTRKKAPQRGPQNTTTDKPLRVGDYFAVVGWPTIQDRSYEGDVYRVVAVCGRLVAGECDHSRYTVGGNLGKRISLDSRAYTLVRVTEDYLAALRGTPAPTDTTQPPTE